MKSPFLRRFGMPSPFFDNEAGFSPTVLLTGSTAFLWLDPSDLTTMFQDAAGTTPVTAPAQPVGLVLDKSQGLVLGSQLVTNGTFDTDTAWVKGQNWTISSGVASASASPVGANLTQLIATQVGRTYQITYTATVVSGGVSAIFGGVFGIARNVSGTYTEVFVATGTSTTIGVQVRLTTLTGTIDNISVRELPGFHATQSTAANRPTYGVVPSRGRVNLLTYSEDFGNAVWVKSNCTFSSGVVTTTTNSDGLTQAISNYTSNASHATTWRVVAGTATWLRFVIRETASSTNRISGWFNVATGTAGSATNGGTGSGSTLSFTQVSAGVYDVTLVGAVNNSATAVTVQVSTATADQSAAGVSGVTYGVQRVQTELGTTASPYQRVVSQFDVTDPAGFPSYPLHYLSFDGVDDFLVTPTITTEVNKSQAFIGIRKLSDATRGSVFELTAVLTNRISLEAPQANGSANYGFASGGTVTAFANSANSFAAPESAVLTGLGDISAPSAILRRNGVQVGQSTASQGTGNYANAQMWIGRRTGTTLPFNGQLYGLIVRFSSANLDAGLLGQTEKWMGDKTGVTIA